MIYSVGSIFLDHIINIKSFPKKPVKIFAKGIEKRLGGSAAVASFTIKKLGLDISFIGRFGDDDASKFLKGQLKKFKINFKDSITIKGAKSSQSYVFEDKNGERLLGAFNEKKLLNNSKLPKIIFKKNTTFIADIRWVNATLYLAKNCSNKKINLVVDLDNYKIDKKIKQIIKLSSHPIFSETGAMQYSKSKSIIFASLGSIEFIKVSVLPSVYVFVKPPIRYILPPCSS